MTPILISSIGDMFLSDGEGKIYWLNVADGNLEIVATNIIEFKKKINDPEIVSDWFMTDLVAEIKKTGQALSIGKLFGYKKLPALGGEYLPDNFELTDIEIHFSIAGQIHEQIKDLPRGTPINIKLK
jgi:hypothetical protein